MTRAQLDSIEGFVLSPRPPTKGTPMKKRRPLTREDREARALVRFINRTAREVARWPVWMRGKPDPSPRRP